jgi:hypothetical protein
MKESRNINRKQAHRKNVIQAKLTIPSSPMTEKKMLMNCFMSYLLVLYELYLYKKMVKMARRTTINMGPGLGPCDIPWSRCPSSI